MGRRGEERRARAKGTPRHGGIKASTKTGRRDADGRTWTRRALAQSGWPSRQARWSAFSPDAASVSASAAAARPDGRDLRIATQTCVCPAAAARRSGVRPLWSCTNKRNQDDSLRLWARGLGSLCPLPCCSRDESSVATRAGATCRFTGGGGAPSQVPGRLLRR